jgi:hypothetical protein
MEFLWRYTELPFLIHLLKTKRLTLLSPKLWDDMNDSHYIEIYRKRKELKTVLALCFTEKRETYHHWSVFSGSKAGISIAFYKNKLVSWAQHQGLRYGSVEYYNNKEIHAQRLDIDKLPFIKPKAFQDEKEFRLLYEDNQVVRTVMEFEIELNIIRRIRISPWLPKSIVRSVKDTIKSIDGCENLEVYHSTLLDNETWKKAGSALL